MIFMSLCDWKCSFMTARKVSFQPDFIHQKDDDKIRQKNHHTAKTKRFSSFTQEVKTVNKAFVSVLLLLSNLN